MAEPRGISHIRVLQSVRFLHTEKTSVHGEKDKCTFARSAEGVVVSSEKCPTILIPWSNIAWVELK